MISLFVEREGGREGGEVRWKLRVCVFRYFLHFVQHRHDIISFQWNSFFDFQQRDSLNFQSFLLTKYISASC